MKSFGSYQAKTYLPELLNLVSRGEKIVITKRGKPVAMLVPVQDEKANVSQVVEDMLEYRNQSGPRLGKGLSLRSLREEGRR